MIETSGHLPECDDWRIGARRGVRACICDRLRACEERVREGRVSAATLTYRRGYAAGQADMREYLLADDTHSYTYGHRAALDAARDAVEELGKRHPKWDLMSTHYEDCWKHHSECALTLALAAIDALKGEADV